MRLLTSYGKSPEELPLDDLLREAARVIEFGSVSARIRVAIADELNALAPTVRAGSLRGNEALVTHVAMATAERSGQRVSGLAEWNEIESGMRSGYVQDAEAALKAIDEFGPK